MATCARKVVRSANALKILPGLQHEQPVQRVVVLELHQDVVAVPLGVALGLALQAQEVVTGHCTRVPNPRKLRAASRARTESDGKRDEKRRRFRGSPVDAGGRARRADRRRERALDAVCPPRARDAWDRSRRGFDGDLACAPRCAGDSRVRGVRGGGGVSHRRPRAASPVSPCFSQIFQLETRFPKTKSRRLARSDAPTRGIKT